MIWTQTQNSKQQQKKTKQIELDSEGSSSILNVLVFRMFIFLFFQESKNQTKKTALF